jgi:acetyl esterase/lipase
MLAGKARDAGVEIILDVHEERIHVFKMFAAELPEARQGIAAAGAFLEERLS